MKLTARKKV